LTSARGFLEALIFSTKMANGTSDYTFEWSCIVLPDNGAFYINYVITSALIGTAFELMRVSELFSKTNTVEGALYDHGYFRGPFLYMTM
jgi:hypothetical protein